jgi:hypothetical protein
MIEKKSTIYWDGEAVGWMLDYQIDHFRFYGTWKSANTLKSEIFLEMLNTEDKQLWVKVGNMDTWWTVEFPPDPWIELTMRLDQKPD